MIAAVTVPHLAVAIALHLHAGDEVTTHHEKTSVETVIMSVGTVIGLVALMNVTEIVSASVIATVTMKCGIAATVAIDASRIVKTEPMVTTEKVIPPYFLPLNNGLRC